MQSLFQRCHSVIWGFTVFQGLQDISLAKIDENVANFLLILMLKQVAYNSNIFKCTEMRESEEKSFTKTLQDL